MEKQPSTITGISHQTLGEASPASNNGRAPVSPPTSTNRSVQGLEIWGWPKSTSFEVGICGMFQNPTAGGVCACSKTAGGVSWRFHMNHLLNWSVQARSYGSWGRLVAAPPPTPIGMLWAPWISQELGSLGPELGSLWRQGHETQTYWPRCIYLPTYLSTASSYWCICLGVHVHV